MDFCIRNDEFRKVERGAGEQGPRPVEQLEPRAVYHHPAERHREHRACRPEDPPQCQ